jgi:hypothetical protein
MPHDTNAPDARGFSSPIPRRMIIKGAAWSAPVIALAVASPAHAASEAGLISFSPSAYTNPSGLGYTTLTGTVTPVSGQYPAQLAVTYSQGFSGPISVAVDQQSGSFTVQNVTSPSAVRTGTITATATSYTSGTATLSVTDPEPRSGSIDWNPDQYRGTRQGDRVLFPTLTGTVVVTGGPMPSTIILSFSEPSPGRVDLRRDAGLTVPIDPDTGDFSVDGVYNAIVGGDNPFGFIYAGVLDPDGINYGRPDAELDG